MLKAQAKKQKMLKKISLRRLSIVFIGAVFTLITPTVYADIYQQQIDQLNAQNSQTQTQVDALANQASSYQAEINQLQAQISALQNAINQNQTKQAQIENQITTDQNEIAKDKQTLSDVIRTMYVNGQVSTIEMLATSKSISDFVDAETYRDAVSNEVNSLVNQISADEAQLKVQNTQLTEVIGVEQQQNNQLSSAQAQQQQLLSYNQQQQDAYNSQIQSNNSQISVLRQEQIDANRRLDGSGQVISSGSCGGSYPATAVSPYGGNWGCDYGLDNTLDNWAMYNRECVSYTAWMVNETYGINTSGFGDANQWPGNAQAAGIATGSTPKVGSVAIYMGGYGDPWGHAMWVVGISGNEIHVFSYNDGYDGNFYDHWVNASGLTYIYFGG